jgi:ABC-type enterobactin transport system permease subunit
MRTRTAVGLAGAVVTVVGAVVVAVPSVTRLLLPDPVVGLLSSVGAGPVLLAARDECRGD